MAVGLRPGIGSGSEWRGLAFDAFESGAERAHSKTLTRLTTPLRQIREFLERG
jgi:hypothetical protein